MIVEGILNAIKLFLKFLINLFPTLPAFEDSSGFLNKLGEVVGYANLFCYLNVVLSCLVLCFVVANARAIWALIMWIVRKIPGVS